MKKNLFKVVLGCAIVLSAASCVKEITSNNDLYRPVGSPIVFAAATGYDNGITTRTSYSGETFNVSGYSNKFERIDWVENDEVKVHYFNGNATAVYTVGAPGSSSEKSSASISSQNGLDWADTDTDHIFYAMYPNTGFDAGHGANSSASLSGSAVSGSIPAAQTVYLKTGTTEYEADMALGYLVAKKTINANSTDSTVDLPFRPATTTFKFRFKVDAGSSGPAAVTSFEMSSGDPDTPLAGNFSFNMANGADSDQRGSATWSDVTKTGTSDKITVTFSPAATITADNYLEFTVFALPIDIHQVTLKFTYEGGATKSLKLKPTDTTWDEFDACTKYVITNGTVPGGDWVYTLEHEIPTAGMHRATYLAGNATKNIFTYKTHIGDEGGHTDGEQIPVEVKYRYSLADEEGNNLNEWSATRPAWLSNLVDQLPPDTNPTDIAVLTGTYTQMPTLIDTTINQIDTHALYLFRKGVNGFSSAAPQDLTLYDINALTTPRAGGIVKTANCYVVDRAGWYMFPLVYGNAIDYEMGDAVTGWNDRSYTDGKTGWEPANLVFNSSAGNVLHTLRNYVNEDITSPYILDDISGSVSDYEAVIVWEDAPLSKQFVSNVSIVTDPSTTATYKDRSGSAKTVPYIKFEVLRNTIREGNAVIALREKSGSRRIVWSWNIWVSDSDLGTNQLASLSTVVPSNDMLKWPVGYCDDMIETFYHYNPRICYVEVTHVEAESTCAPLVFKVTQVEDSDYRRSIPTANLYQYGRKDAFLGFTRDVVWWTLINNWATDDDRHNLRNKDSHSPANYQILDDARPDIMIYKQSHTSLGDVSYGIQHPNACYNNDDMEDPAPQDWTNAIHRNFWNMAEKQGLQQPEGDVNYHPELDLKVIKTVYDPCPPGFSVPNYAAFTIFLANAPGPGLTPTMDPSTANGEPYDGFVWGTVFYANDAMTETIYLPSTGFRGRGGWAEHQFRTSAVFFHTSKSRGRLYSLAFNTGQWSPYGPIGICGRGTGMIAVLPAKEIFDNSSYQSVVAGGQGTDGYYNPGDLDSNWQ